MNKLLSLPRRAICSFGKGCILENFAQSDSCAEIKLRELDQKCLFKIDAEGYEEHLIDELIRDPHAEHSMSI
jgi:hypothetical protein